MRPCRFTLLLALLSASAAARSMEPPSRSNELKHTPSQSEELAAVHRETQAAVPSPWSMHAGEVARLQGGHTARRVTEQIQLLHQHDIAELQRAHHVQASAKPATHQEELRSTIDEWHRQVRRMRDEHAEQLTMLRDERDAAERGLVVELSRMSSKRDKLVAALARVEHRAHAAESLLLGARSSHAKAVHELQMQLDSRTGQLERLRRTCACSSLPADMPQHEGPLLQLRNSHASNNIPATGHSASAGGAAASATKQETNRSLTFELPHLPMGRALLRDMAQRYCSGAEIRTVLDVQSQSRRGAVELLLTTNVQCALCIIKQISLPTPDVLLAVQGCMHQVRCTPSAAPRIRKTRQIWRAGREPVRCVDGSLEDRGAHPTCLRSRPYVNRSHARPCRGRCVFRSRPISLGLPLRMRRRCWFVCRPCCHLIPPCVAVRHASSFRYPESVARCRLRLLLAGDDRIHARSRVCEYAAQNSNGLPNPATPMCAAAGGCTGWSPAQGGGRRPDARVGLWPECTGSGRRRPFPSRSRRHAW